MEWFSSWPSLQKRQEMKFLAIEWGGEGMGWISDVRYPASFSCHEKYCYILVRQTNHIYRVGIIPSLPFCTLSIMYCQAYGLHWPKKKNSSHPFLFRMQHTQPYPVHYWQRQRADILKCQYSCNTLFMTYILKAVNHAMHPGGFRWPRSKALDQFASFTSTK